MRKNVALQVQEQRPAEDFFQRSTDRFERKFDDWPAEVIDTVPVEAANDEPINLLTGGLQHEDIPACINGSGIVVEEELLLLSGEYNPSQTPEYYLSVYANGIQQREGSDYTVCSGTNICIVATGDPVVLAKYVVAL